MTATEGQNHYLLYPMPAGDMSSENGKAMSTWGPECPQATPVSVSGRGREQLGLRCRGWAWCQQDVVIEGLVRVLPFSHGNLWAQGSSLYLVPSVSWKWMFSLSLCPMPLLRVWLHCWKARQYLELWARGQNRAAGRRWAPWVFRGESRRLVACLFLFCLETKHSLLSGLLAVAI